MKFKCHCKSGTGGTNDTKYVGNKISNILAVGEINKIVSIHIFKTILLDYYYSF